MAKLVGQEEAISIVQSQHMVYMASNSEWGRDFGRKKIKEVCEKVYCTEEETQQAIRVFESEWRLCLLALDRLPD